MYGWWVGGWMSSVLCKEMISDPGPRGWNGGEAEWEAERQILCRQLYRSLTALGRCYALLSYMRLIDPDFSVYTRALMVSSKLGRKRKQAVVSMSGRQTLFSLAATAEQVHSTAVSSTGQWEYRVSNSRSMLNLYGSPKKKGRDPSAFPPQGCCPAAKAWGFVGLE